MRRFLALFVLLPLAVIVIALSVANRGNVTFSLDPIGGGSTGWSATGPFYVFLFGAVVVGVIVGGIATWLRQGRWRHAARVERANADRLRLEVERLRERIETMPALTGPRDRDAA